MLQAISTIGPIQGIPRSSLVKFGPAVDVGKDIEGSDLEIGRKGGSVGGREKLPLAGMGVGRSYK